MSSVKAYFAELFGNTGQAVFVMDREKNFIYAAPALEKSLSSMEEQDRFALDRAADDCLRWQKSDVLVLDQKEWSLLPYPYEDEWYIVGRVAENHLPDQEQLLKIFRNSQDKINGYLNEIYGETQRIGLKTPPGEKIGGAVRRILRAVHHIDMALDGSGQMDYRVPMDLGAVAEAYVDAYLEVAPTAPVVVRKREAKTYASVLPENLELILGTLISNGLRFSGGQVSLEVTHLGDRVRLTVCDNGPGVQDPDRLFEPGYRTMDRKNVRGLGYSLYMAKRLAEQQGAALLYERRGNETCFHFEADAVDLPEGRLASWKPEDPDNSLSQLRIEMSDYIKEMDL